MSKPNSVVESSSDNEETISSINTEHPSTPDLQCSICFDESTNPCRTNSCLHSFCFECLKRWSNSRQFCPLCKQTFSYIFHSFDDLGDYETYDAPRRLQDYGISSDDETSSDDEISSDYDSDSEYEEIVPGIPVLDRVLYSDAIGQIQCNPVSETTIIGQTIRIQVYVENMWAEPLQAPTGRIRDCSPNFYRDNPLEMDRLQLFILREVAAVREAQRLEGQDRLTETNVTISNFIMRSLLRHDILQLHSINGLRTSFEAHAVHFCHELYHFAISSYDISDYDRNVQLTYRPRATELTERLPIEKTVLNSDNEEVPRPIINTNVSSSTDDSDVAILSHSIHSIKPLNSDSIDQPSTSTGIQDSLNQPNNSFQSVDGGLSLNLSHVRRRRLNLDSSSDDEDSIIATQGSKTAHVKSQNNHHNK